MFCSMILSLLINEGVSTCKAEELTELRDRLITEAPQKWEQYRARAKRLQGYWLVTNKVRFVEKEKLLSCRYEVKQNAVGASFVKQPLEDAKDPGYLLALNSRYGFKLQRLKPENPWSVAGMNLNLEDGYKLSPWPPDWLALHLANRPFNFTAGFSIVNALPYLIKQPEFSVKEVTPVQKGGTELVRLEFTNLPHTVTRQNYKEQAIPDDWINVSGGWVLLDPAHYWVFREFHVEFEDPGNHARTDVENRFEYKDGQNGLPILSKIEGHYTGHKGGEMSPRTILEQRSTTEFDLAERDDVPESDFTLSAYGFPEPPSLQPKIPLFVWIALAGLLCLVGAMTIRWWLGRQRKSREATT